MIKDVAKNFERGQGSYLRGPDGRAIGGPGGAFKLSVMYFPVIWPYFVPSDDTG